MTLISIQVGQPQTHGRPDAIDPTEKPWTSAIFKQTVAGPLLLSRTNLAGDRQADLENHGGPDKAVNAYASEHYSYWQEVLGITLLPNGAFGENFTTAGLVEDVVCIGDVFKIGKAVVQISQPRQPCWKLARRWRIKDLALQVQETGRTGWYFRVLDEGEVEAGNTFTLVERRHPQWTIATANEIMHRRKTDFDAAHALASCPDLSISWQQSLSKRASTGRAAGTAARLDGAT